VVAIAERRRIAAALRRPVTADASFRLENVSPGEYSTTIELLPPAYYVKEARLDEVNVLEQPVVISGPVSRTLDVLLSRAGGRVDGTVVDNRGQAFQECRQCSCGPGGNLLTSGLIAPNQIIYAANSIWFVPRL